MRRNLNRAAKIAVHHGLVLFAVLMLGLLVARPSWAQGDDDDSGVNLPTPASGAQAPSDQWDFQTDLFTGRFTMSVPIRVAPGRGAVTPSLALGYNSGAANGWCGVGWTLDTASIQRNLRDGTPIGHGSDGMPNSSYSPTCPFETSFGGVQTRLFNIGGSAYASEVERNFIKYIHDPSGGGWTAVDKAGTTYYFGSTPASQISNQFGTYRWAVDKIVDINGNTAFYSYTNDMGQLYPIAIDYNANPGQGFPATHHVSFALETRPDTNINCKIGVCITQAQRLHQITVFLTPQAGITNFVRQYTLVYTNSTSTYRSLLAEIDVSGSNSTSILPPVKFQYQQMAFAFKDPQGWGPLVPPPGQSDNNVRWTSLGSGINQIESQLIDINGDGLPDRVMRKSAAPSDLYYVQLNTGQGFAPTNILWRPLQASGVRDSASHSQSDGTNVCHFSYGNLGAMTDYWGYVSGSGSDNGPFHNYLGLMDMNGDGLPDRVMRPADVQICKFTIDGAGHTNWSSGPPAYTNLMVQLNNGTGFYSEQPWYSTTNGTGSMIKEWSALSQGQQRLKLTMLDINGDGYPDRVMWFGTNNATTYLVQLNTGTGFSNSLVQWGPLNNTNAWARQYDRVQVTSQAGSSPPFFLRTAMRLQDINGDGLPDRLMVKTDNSAYAGIAVQLNNGIGFEPTERYWGGGTLTGVQGNQDYGPVISTTDASDGSTLVELIDINGDGLPDRVLAPRNGENYFTVQLNTGTGFGPPIAWSNVNAQGSLDSRWSCLRVAGTSVGNIWADLVDINGDGLPDRVMSQRGNGPYTNLVVQLNAGPFPDLMNRVDNGMGGWTKINYVPSTQYTNTGPNDVSLLPMPTYTVSSMTTCDGRGNTNTTGYYYKGGYYDWDKQEFRGFNQVEVTDPLGTKTVTYFHQGRQATITGTMTPDGLFSDDDGKQGTPYLIEVYGSDGNLYSKTIDLVEVFPTHTNATATCTFPFVQQTTKFTYPVGATAGAARTTAVQYNYDTETGNLLDTYNLGEVTANPTGAITGYVSSNQIYTHTRYASFSGAYSNVLSRPSQIWTSSDPPPGTHVLQITYFYYNSSALLTNISRGIDWDGTFATTSINGYDLFGNPTSATDPAGITRVTSYDSVYELYPTQQVVGAIFTNTVSIDPRTGQALTATDPKGLKSETVYDVFYRPQETRLYTNATDFVWKQHYDYQTGGMGSDGTSSNSLTVSINDGNSLTVTNLQTTTYYDGLGRAIQTRVKSEVPGLYRVATTEYNARGQVQFQSLPLFCSGQAYSASCTNSLGTLTQYDPVGRVSSVTPPKGDANSPTGASTVSYVDPATGDPWATVATDPMSNQRISHMDSNNHVINIVQATADGGRFTTSYAYDLLGRLIQVTDNAGSITTMQYDSLGRKRQMTDPDMGTWSYNFDSAGRMTLQKDNKQQVITFDYSGDPLGRLMRKFIYNAGGTLVATVSNTWDVSDDPSNYTVFKGQLYKLTDRQGTVKASYDIRGRALKATRHLNTNDTDYTVQSQYDELDRVTSVSYPENTAAIQYSYDTAGHLQQVQSTCGTGSNETFYTANGFNEVGQLTNMVFGNGVQTTLNYYTNSKRLNNIITTKTSVTLQSLGYTYDAMSDILGIQEGADTGAGSQALLSATYDGLYQLTGYTLAGATYNNTYDPKGLGNIKSGTEFGTGSYTYDLARPHAVTSVGNGTSFSYDANGNMTNRNGQVLVYDEENQLVAVTNKDGSYVTFGYADGGARLWEISSTSGLHVWIGGIYEIKAGKKLCHVLAGSRRVATFEVTSPVCQLIQRTPWLAACSTAFNVATTWPLQENRTPLTAALIPLVGILCASIFSRRRAVVGRVTPPGVRSCRRPAFRRSALPSAIFGRHPEPVEGSLPSDFGVALSRRYARLHLRAYPLWLQFISILLIVATWLAVTPTQVDAQQYSPVFYYYHPDQLGSSSVLTDRSGNQVDRIGYKAFGQQQAPDNSSAFQVSNRYTGQIFDSDTGLYYYNARYYDPVIGRFTQPDSMVTDPANPQDYNRYSYVHNNPLNQTDPSGHGNWLTGAWHSIADQFHHASGWELAGIVVAYASPYGWAYAIAAVLIVEFAAARVQEFNTAVAVVEGVADIVVGAILCCTPATAPAGIGLIAAGALSLASISAGLAGDQNLSANLGWAALGVSVASLVYGIASAAAAQGSPSDQGSAGQPQSLDGGGDQTGINHSNDMAGPGAGSDNPNQDNGGSDGFGQLKTRSVDDWRAQAVGGTHSFWYVQGSDGQQYIISGWPRGGCLDISISNDIYGGIDNITAGTSWDSGISLENGAAADKLIQAAKTWPQDQVEYNAMQGANSNTAAHYLARSAGFSVPAPHGSYGWDAWWGASR